MLLNTRILAVGIYCSFIAMSGCGGGGGSGTPPSDKNSTTPDSPSSPTQEQTLSVSAPEDFLRKLPADQKYFAVSESGLSEVSGDLSVQSDKAYGDSELVILSSEFGEPMALGVRHEGEQSVVVDLASSAVVFVLRNERFFGVEFHDLKAVEGRIKTHPKFPDLVADLQSEIDDQSPCPMNPNCSFLATMTADEIAVTLDIDGLQYTADGGLN